MKTLKHLFEKNEAWATRIKNENPELFSELSKEQKPKYLWIGCSDSRVPANQIVELPPGEVFVHRNIANMVVHTDLNCLSVIQFAVEVLKIKHIIVCGHYGCGGVQAAMKKGDNGLIDNWLGHIQDVERLYDSKLQGLEFPERHDRMCEFNVIEQVANVCKTPTVRGAWKRGQELSVHGWIYALDTGLLKDLDYCITSIEELEEKYPAV